MTEDGVHQGAFSAAKPAHDDEVETIFGQTCLQLADATMAFGFIAGEER
jgi:hypothetical protein